MFFRLPIEEKKLAVGGIHQPPAIIEPHSDGAHIDQGFVTVVFDGKNAETSDGLPQVSRELRQETFRPATRVEL